MTVNGKIRNYIEENGIKLTEVARKTGISRQNLSRILDSNDIKVSQLLALSEALGVEPGVFVELPGARIKLKQLEENVKLVNDLVELQKKHIERLEKDLYLKPANTYFVFRLMQYLLGDKGKSNTKINNDIFAFMNQPIIRDLFEYDKIKYYSENMIEGYQDIISSDMHIKYIEESILQFLDEQGLLASQ